MTYKIHYRLTCIYMIRSWFWDLLSVFYEIHQTWDLATKTYNVPDRDFGTDFETGGTDM